jgi:tRNA(fMet)-specific endonuclease VapC
VTARYLLDTDVCIAFLNQQDKALRKQLQLADPDQIRLCSVVKAELLSGARNSAKVNENLQRLQQFLSAFDSLSFDDHAAEHYGSLRAHLRRSGTPVGANDMLIAAIAMANDLSLVTRNQVELQRIVGLRLERW